MKEGVVLVHQIHSRVEQPLVRVIRNRKDVMVLVDVPIRLMNYIALLINVALMEHSCVKIVDAFMKIGNVITQTIVAIIVMK